MTQNAIENAARRAALFQLEVLMDDKIDIRQKVKLVAEAEAQLVLAGHLPDPEPLDYETIDAGELWCRLWSAHYAKMQSVRIKGQIQC